MQASSPIPGAASTLKRIRPEDMPLEDVLPPIKKARESGDIEEQSETSSPTLTSQDKGKQKMVDSPSTDSMSSRLSEDNARLVAELENELSCGCCAGLVYRPVVLQPCQHFFCGSCVTLWIQNSASNTCPQCRTTTTHANSSRTIQSIVDLLLRHRPDLQRTEGERRQADEIWAPAPEIKIPQPRPTNPDVLLPQSRAHDPTSDNLARPCPHCLLHNQFGWRCPRPIADPDVNPEAAWNIDDGPPPGHGFCGACSELHALSSPGSSACSLCKTSYCGLSIPHLCVAPSVRSSRLPQSSVTLTGLLESHSESIWECFDFNEVEIEILLDWLREGRQGSIRAVYQEMVDHIRNSGEGFQPMIAAGLFVSDHNNINPLPESERLQSRPGGSQCRD
ncbi:hypothetical protein BS47DRAFT_1082271 [Hydnum rufescens UP504]|uniref:RING-type domain-containing protein n=1 Tax=Hydnum rufescens UP504 TaxID=1448309 RepID=A0A9P6DZN7_9AGAM|nr:hypothetical protein BS47DRAFT_1082271 [Hydnum rufescens UP504]